MRRRTAARMAWSLWALVLLASVLGAGFAVGAVGADPQLIAFLVFVMAFSTMGALVGSRQPANPIGWLMCGTALSWVAAGGSLVYGESILGDATVPPIWTVLVWPLTWGWNVGISLATFALLFFPNGRLPSPRWRIAVAVVALGTALTEASNTLAAGPIEDTTVTNPLGIRGAETVLDFAGMVGFVSSVLGVLAAVAAIVVRFRRAHGAEREQIKWLAYAGAVVAVCVPAATAIETLIGTEAAADISNFTITLSLALIPTAIGIAILRYRLYDIDRVVNKTLVYGLLTVVLVAGYAMSVLLVQSLLPLSDDSPIVVAASTLVMVALFGPLRRRIQNIVDRRFYRRRYDAARTVEDFSARLRNEIDLDELTAHLLDVVSTSVNPSSASLWLRERIRAEQ